MRGLYDPDMSRFGTQYQVSRPTGRCAHTGEAMAPGTSCIATLIERSDDDGFDRLDFSIEAWEEGVRPAGLFSYWKTIVPDAEKKEKLLVDDQVLLDLFERLAHDDRPQRLAFRFVLGLILMRKRLLKQIGRTTKIEGETARAVWLLRMKGAEPESPPMELVDPALDEDDIRALTEQLGEILNSELSA